MGPILVVDDEPVIRDLIVSILEDEGYDVLEAPTGLRALELVQHTPPALILMDIMMPGITGVETTRRLQEMEEMRSVPVILMSAGMDLSPHAVAIAGFLSKPFDIEHLLQIIDTVLDTGTPDRRVL
jgi:CheY-like chemotaxis protein